MLQKGFLKFQGKNGDSGALKANVTFTVLLVAGAAMMLFALLYMTVGRRADAVDFYEHIANVFAPVMIAGICMALAGIWMKFFVQNRNRRRK